MEGFFDFIFGNIFIVVIIIAAVLNFLNKGKQAEREEQRKQQPANPRPNQDRTRERSPARVERPRPVQQAKQTIKTVQKNTLNTIEEQRQEQYDRLKSQYQTASDGSPSNVMEKGKLQTVEEETSKVNVKLENKLTPEGLIESVIMAEVLGPPRALNPYQNIVVKRKQNRR